MKQKIKRLVLWLCLAAGLVSMTACARTASADKTADPQLASTYCPQFEQFLTQLSACTDEQLDVFAENIRNNTSLETEEVNAYVTGFDSLKNVRGDLGGFVSVLSSELQNGDDRGSYVCVVEAQYEKRTMEFKVFFTESQSGVRITGMSFSPDYTISERMQKAGLNTVMGLAVVFAVLIFISLLIYCFRFIGGQPAASGETAQSAAPSSSEDEEIAAVIAAAIAASEDDELTAVITAAVAAYEAESAGSSDPLIARSFRHARRTKRRW